LGTEPTAGESSVLQTIAEETTAVRQFVDLLKLEQTSLSNGSTDDLLDFAEQKSKLATQLNKFAAQRSALLVAQGFSADRTGVDAWCASYSSKEEAGASWSGLLSLAAEARELNRLNGELIQMRMQYNANALEALRGGKNALDLYGPDGQSTSPGHRRINDAV
jgi:flagella synthesis protein FlgN